jgi:hypothetical protein
VILLALEPEEKTDRTLCIRGGTQQRSLNFSYESSDIIVQEKMFRIESNNSFVALSHCMIAGFSNQMRAALLLLITQLLLISRHVETEKFVSVAVGGRSERKRALLPGHGDGRPNSPFVVVQEERLDEFVDVLGALQLQRVPCVLDDL